MFTATALLLGCNTCLAQVSTMGTTAMGLPSTPGAIVTSALNGPSPFSATTQPGAADTTLAPVPLASDPTTPGTVVTCSTPSGQIAPGTPAVPVTSVSAMGGATAPIASISPAPAISAAPVVSSTSSNTTALALSAQPATSFMSVLPGSTAPAPQPPALPALPPPSLGVPAVPGTMASTTTMAPAAIAPATALGTIGSSIVVGSTTGTISPVSPLGSPSTTVCSSTPGGPPTNGAALPLSTPVIPSSPAPGTIQPVVAQLGDTSLDPTVAVVPTPNSATCRESVSMSLANPGMAASANATGAAATPGVSPAGC
jgi:hypothetical protein